MLCALHRDRRQQLPSDRIELYEAGCQMLLERRDSERRVELRDYPLVSYRQKRALLQDFAYWLLANGWSEVTQERADERIALRLRDMEGISRDATGADVRRLFVGRSGLLREPIPGHIDFTHRTFQEFLAAQAALDEGDLGVLVKNAHDDQWQEVIVLAAGIASKKFREELIAALIARGDQESSRRHQLHLLAVACLETALELGSEVKAEVRKRLAALIPPKNMREAKALASAGELAVPFLVRKTPQRATFTAASVRTLALIGGEAALNALESYEHDTRQVVVAELVRAWDAFDRADYASRVLSSICTRGHHLEVVGSCSLEGVQHLADLSSLALFRCSQVSDLSPLTLLPNLTALALIFCKKIKDLSPLRAITKLNSFKLWNCEAVDDLTPLAELINLTSLDIGGVIPISDLRPLASLLNLAELEIRVLEHVRDLSPLTGLPKLTRLKLWYLPHVRDLEVLVSLPNLSRLALGNFPHIVNLDLLPQLSKLTDLSLTYFAQLHDLSPLAGLGRLTKLGLSSLQRVSGLSPLASMSNLTSLELDNCERVTDLSPLAGLTNLTYLSLNNLPHVRSLKPLAQLKNLEELWLTRMPQGIEIPREIKKKTRLYSW
jgi:hypothetical protein